MKSVVLELDDLFVSGEDVPLLVKFDEGDGRDPSVFWIGYPRARILLEQIARKCLEVRVIQTLETLQMKTQEKSVVAKAA
jgi:hypothetical protein